MQRREGSFTGSGGLTIYYQYWQPEGDVRAVLLLAHGAAEHGGRYERLAEFLTARGIVVAALDHAGHGRSEGEPGFVNRFADYVRDLGAFQQEMQGVAAGTPSFLLGHSLMQL